MENYVIYQEMCGISRRELMALIKTSLGAFVVVDMSPKTLAVMNLTKV